MKSWSPSQANSDLFLLFLFSTTYISPSYKQNHFPFYKHVKSEKEKQHNQSHTRNNMLKQKQKNTNTNTKVKKKEEMQLPYSITLHQASNIYKREVREVSESRCPRSADYIYIYILCTSEKYIQTLMNARRQKDMAYSLFPVPCLSVCLQTFCRHPCFRGNCVYVGKLCWVPNIVGWYLTVGKGKGIFLLIFFNQFFLGRRRGNIFTTSRIMYNIYLTDFWGRRRRNKE